MEGIKVDALVEVVVGSNLVVDRPAVSVVVASVVVVGS